MAKAADRIGKVDKVLWASCNRATDHTIRGAYDTFWDHGEDGEHGRNEHDLLRKFYGPARVRSGV